MNFKPILTATAAVVLVAGVAGCADYYGPGPGPGYYAGPVADIDYDGYYDGFYGPIYDGYWGDGGAFYYRTSASGRYRRADATHMRHDAAPGFNHITGHTPAAHAGSHYHPG